MTSNLPKGKYIKLGPGALLHCTLSINTSFTGTMNNKLGKSHPMSASIANEPHFLTYAKKYSTRVFADSSLCVMSLGPI